MKETIYKILRFVKNLIKLFIPPIAWMIAVGCGSWLVRKAVRLIKRHPGRALIAFGLVIVLTNVFNYMGMKAKVNTAEWRYDTLRLHTDSIEEIYNINKNYSRITSYGPSQD